MCRAGIIKNDLAKKVQCSAWHTFPFAKKRGFPLDSQGAASLPVTRIIPHPHFTLPPRCEDKEVYSIRTALTVHQPYIQRVSEAAPEGLSNSSTVTITDNWLDYIVCVCECVMTQWVHLNVQRGAGRPSQPDLFFFCANTILQSLRHRRGVRGGYEAAPILQLLNSCLETRCCENSACCTASN